MSAEREAKEVIFQSGDKFRGYVVERLLGNGSLGAVYLVKHEILETRFALKVLFPAAVSQNADYVKRFLREAKIMTRVRHQNLVCVHDCGFDEERGLYFLVMDYVSGGDLRQAIAFAGRFEPDRAVEVIIQVARALEAAHEFKIVHRDIKPENIMIQPNGLVKLVDLGIAKADTITDSLNTSSDVVIGTPMYIAPEQALDSSSVDIRADIYSLGVVLFEMIVGKTPYQGLTPQEILAKTLSNDPFPDIRDFNPDIPPMLAVLIRRMCVKERDRRISNPTELIEQFRKLGYDTGADAMKGSVGYAHPDETAPTLTSMKDVLAKIPSKARDTLSFDTDDVEIKAFVEKLKMRRRNKRIALVAIIASIAVFAIAAVISLVFR